MFAPVGPSAVDFTPRVKINIADVFVIYGLRGPRLIELCQSELLSRVNWTKRKNSEDLPRWCFIGAIRYCMLTISYSRR